MGASQPCSSATKRQRLIGHGVSSPQSCVLLSVLEIRFQIDEPARELSDIVIMNRVVQIVNALDDMLVCMFIS